MLGNYKPASDRQTELDKFFALSGYPLMVMREIYNRLYGEIDTSPLSSPLTVRCVTYTLQSFSSDVKDGDAYVSLSQAYFGAGYQSEPIFDNGRVVEYVVFNDVSEFPPTPCIFHTDYSDTSFCTGLIQLKFYDLPRSSSSFPSYLKKNILDSNYRLRKMEIVLNSIFKSLHSSSIFDYLKSFLTRSRLYSSTENTEISTQETGSFLPAIITSADTLVDGLDLVVDIIDYIASQVDDEESRSTLKRIENTEVEVKECLTDEEKLNKLIGSALNVSSPSDAPVVFLRDDGFYDFGKFWGYLDASENIQFVSKDIKDCLPFRDWRSDLL